MWWEGRVKSLQTVVGDPCSGRRPLPRPPGLGQSPGGGEHRAALFSRFHQRAGVGLHPSRVRTSCRMKTFSLRTWETFPGSIYPSGVGVCGAAVAAPPSHVTCSLLSPEAVGFILLSWYLEISK